MNAWLTAAQLRDAYAKKSLSPVDVVKAQLARIEKIDSRYHSFLQVDADNALKAAQQAEQQHQLAELERSIRHCRDVLGLGVRA